MPQGQGRLQRPLEFCRTQWGLSKHGLGEGAVVLCQGDLDLEGVCKPPHHDVQASDHHQFWRHLLDRVLAVQPIHVLHGGHAICLVVFVMVEHSSFPKNLGVVALRKELHVICHDPHHLWPLSLGQCNNELGVQPALFRSEPPYLAVVNEPKSAIWQEHDIPRMGVRVECSIIEQLVRMHIDKKVDDACNVDGDRGVDIRQRFAETTKSVIVHKPQLVCDEILKPE
mmetsp:Transcript_151408/g.264541  ORF Transcript_151408/g.264541 Transcript_151408/m.264541 type:complete len:226 (+) Transcript_151408:751-1428(+)